MSGKPELRWPSTAVAHGHLKLKNKTMDESATFNSWKISLQKSKFWNSLFVCLFVLQKIFKISEPKCSFSPRRECVLKLAAVTPRQSSHGLNAHYH